MTVNSRNVERRSDGNWAVPKPGSSRASATAPTRAAAVKRAREILANDGGGELRIRGLNGQIRAQDTIMPGNDPRASKG
jgi:hypothetical protein